MPPLSQKLFYNIDHKANFQTGVYIVQNANFPTSLKEVQAGSWEFKPL